MVSEPTPVPLRPLERGPLPGRAVYYGVWLLRRLVDLARCRAFDVVFVQRDLFPFSAGLLERLLVARHWAVIYDTDDFLQLPQPGSSHRIFQRLRPLAKYDFITTRAAAVVVASEELAVHAARLNPICEILPMTIDCAPYDAARARRREASYVVVGWSGSKTSLQYLRPLRDVLHAVSETAGRRVRIITGAPEAATYFAPGIEVVPWSSEREPEDLVSLDIGLLPLPDSSFERGKFPYKAVQYCAAGVPIIASDVGPARLMVQHGVNGYLVREDADWRRRIDELAVDPALRRDMGEAGRRIAGERFGAATNARRLDALMRRVAFAS